MSEDKDIRKQQRRIKHNAESDDEYNGSALNRDEDYEDGDSFSYKASKSKRSKPKGRSKSALRVFTDGGDGGAIDPPTPRTRHLLDIVNSRDVAMIKGLSGVGAKKARDLVEFLELQNDDEGNAIKTLKQLRAVPGVGAKTVEKAYEDIAVLMMV